MRRGGPSLTALLGLLAVAGYQNRDKIGDLVRRVQSNNSPDGSKTAASGGGLLGDLTSMFGGSAAGSTLASGMKELVDAFSGTKQADKAHSWVGSGQNQPVSETDLSEVLDPETLATLEHQTGLSRAEIVARLSRDLPHAVDAFSPQGRVPDPHEANELI